MVATSAEFDKATDYQFKESDIERAQALVGLWSPSPAREFLTAATHDAMRNFARGYGDDNPLYTSESYGDSTRWGSQVAPPMIPIALNRPLLGDPPEKPLKRPSFRGIHVFVSGSTWNWYRPIQPGDQLFAFGGTESVVEKKSEFADRSVFVTYASVKMNQRAEIVAISRTLAIHTERKTAREKGKYAAIEPATYTDEDMERLDAVYAAEQVRGAETRWWEDVEVGEPLQPMAKGPLTLTDMIVFHAGGYGFIPYAPCTNRIAYNNRQRIAPFYVKNEYGIPDVAQRVHWDSAWAQAIGNPMAYDYGVMRDCWLSHFMTDWMGDDGWLLSQSSEIRKFNYIGDSHVLTGEVVDKRIEDDNCVVDIEMRGTNQRDTVTCPGRATIALPSREHGPVTLPNPPDDFGEKAAALMERHLQLTAERGARGAGLTVTPDIDNEVRAWVEDNWDETITVREWWRRLAEAGYAYPRWPAGVGGSSASAAVSQTVRAVLARNGVIGPPVGYMAATLAAPTILEHGTDSQIKELVWPIASGEASWCQLFSEPGSGSDLASVGTRAIRDGDEWVVTGQKVWNSAADGADFGMLLARTDVDRPKHQGITYFVIDMHQSGVEARPLRQMNGGSSFCEVFLTEARVRADMVIGELHGGWKTTQTTLANERNSVAGGATPGLYQALSGSTGDLDLTVGEVVERGRRVAKSRNSAVRSNAIPARVMLDLARDYGKSADPVIRQELARYVSQVRVNGWTMQRIAAAGGRLTGADGSVAKITTSQICQVSRDLSYRIVGAAGLLSGPVSPLGGDLQVVGLGSPGTRIGGGTDEIQMTVLGERALGLPREPSGDKDLPYRDLKVGTQRQ